MRKYFTENEMVFTPSQKCGIESNEECRMRQNTAKFIQKIGEKLKVNQLTINTAVVVMHRFYMRYSFTQFAGNLIAPTVIFISAKQEEQSRSVEQVLKATNSLIQENEHFYTQLFFKTDVYIKNGAELTSFEYFVLSTMDYDVEVIHPHQCIVEFFNIFEDMQTFAKESYFMATHSLHKTTMCLQYQPGIVACVCINAFRKMNNYELKPLSNGKSWFSLIDETVTSELLEELSSNLITILDKSCLLQHKYPTVNLEAISLKQEDSMTSPLKTVVEYQRNLTLANDNSNHPSQKRKRSLIETDDHQMNKYLKTTLVLKVF